MTNPFGPEHASHFSDVALARLATMRQLGELQLVKLDENTIGIVDPNDLVDGHPRLLGSTELGVPLDQLFRLIVGPALLHVGDEDNNFLAPDDQQAS